jgi:hypothetical protein
MALGVPGQTAQAQVGGVTNTLTATGSAQTDALLLVDDNNVVTVTAASTGVRLPVLNITAGDWCMVANYGASTLTVYPPVGGKINLGTVNVGVSLTTLKAGIFTAIDGLGWVGVLSA